MTGIVRGPALFLDRDGVVNVDHGYVHRIDQFDFLPGIFELARFVAQDLRWPIVVVSNQSGIGRGLFDEAAHAALTAWMCERFREQQAPIARAYHCPYHPEHGIGDYRCEHDWRKPKPGMILQAAADLDLDLSRSVLIGDRLSDMEAAAAAGIPLRIRLDPLETPADPAGPAHRVVRTLPEALSILRDVQSLQVAGQGRG
jgi:D-glycero-D-manno-heptose 1,7-bisphosphate phosphatase